MLSVTSLKVGRLSGSCRNYFNDFLWTLKLSDAHPLCFVCKAAFIPATVSIFHAKRLCKATWSQQILMMSASALDKQRRHGVTLTE